MYPPAVLVSASSTYTVPIKFVSTTTAETKLTAAAASTVVVPLYDLKYSFRHHHQDQRLGGKTG